MAADDPTCVCGDPQSRHKGGKHGCRNCEIGCARFERDDSPEPEQYECTCASTESSLSNCDVHGIESNEDRLARWEAAQPAPSPIYSYDDRVAEAARLREAERELADAREELDRRLSEALIAKANAEAERDEARAERDANMTSSARAARELIAERDGAAEQWAKARDRIEELEALLAAADKRFTELRAELPVAPVEIHGWDAWQCFTCGNRYRRDFQHACGPLKPVRVSITERGAPTA